MVAMGEAEILNNRIDGSAVLLWSYRTGSSIESISISSNGSYIAAGDWDTVYFFNKEGELLWSRKTGCGFNGVSVSMDAKGSCVAVGSGEDEHFSKETDKKVYLFNREGELLWSYDTGANIYMVSLSADGSHVAAVADRHVFFFDRKGELLWTYKKEGWLKKVEGVCTSGYHVAARCSDREILFFNTEGKLLWRHRTTVGGWFPSLDEVSLSSDGPYVVAVTGGWWLPENKGDLSFFDRDGELLWSYEIEGGTGSVSISSDGSYIAVEGGGNIWFFDRWGKDLWLYNVGANVYVEFVSISSDGSYLAALSTDKRVYFLTREGKLLWSHKIGRGGGEPPIQAILMSSDGVYVAATASRNLYFFNTGVGGEAKEPPALTPSGPEFTKTYITEKETVTTKERKVPVFTAKVLPSKCPACGALFKGRSGDACEYCRAIIKVLGR